MRQGGFPWIPPELRENRGKFEAAQSGRLPSLVELADLKGDLYAHTKAMDGRNNLKEMVAAARERGCFLEVNAHPIRLDLTDMNCQMAKEEGVMVSINSDAHSVLDFENLRYCVGLARRGWLERSNVLNARSLHALCPLLKRTMLRA